MLKLLVPYECVRFGCTNIVYATTLSYYIWMEQIRQMYVFGIVVRVGDYGTFHAEQTEAYTWRLINEDDEGKQHNFKMDIFMVAHTIKVAVNDEWLLRFHEEVRREGRITREDEL